MAAVIGNVAKPCLDVRVISLNVMGINFGITGIYLGVTGNVFLYPFMHHENFMIK